MRDRVVYSDSQNPRFMKTSHHTTLLCFLFARMWVTDIYVICRLRVGPYGEKL